MDFISTIIGALIGGVLGVLSALFSTFYGPKLYEEWKEKRKFNKDLLPRKILLEKMLKDERFKDGRKLSTLTLVTGTSEEVCRNLLITLNARGVKLKEDNTTCEGWALISNKPLNEK